MGAIKAGCKAKVGLKEKKLTLESAEWCGGPSKGAITGPQEESGPSVARHPKSSRREASGNDPKRKCRRRMVSENAGRQGWRAGGKAQSELVEGKGSSNEG